MAYASTVTVKERKVSGRRYFTYLVSETDASASDYFTLTAPILGTIVQYQTELVSGTGTTVQPTLGKAVGFSADTADEIATQSSAAASINDGSAVRYLLHDSSEAQVDSIYVYSTVDAGSDNVIETVIVIAEGQDA